MRLHMLGEETAPKAADVIVVGGGLAGHCAAIGALEAGSTVLLIEKQAEYGGSSLLSGGSMSFAGTQAQASQGIVDSPEELRRDLLDVGENKSDPALIDLFVEHNLETYHWLKNLGVIFHTVQLSSNMSVPRSHPVRPQDLMATLHERARTLGLQYIAGTSARRLLQDQHGRVCGVEAVIGGESIGLQAEAGVILASGGFARSAKLVEQIVPDQARALRLGGEGNTGDGLIMAWSLGADLVDLPYVKATFGVAMPDYPGSNQVMEGPRTLTHAMYRGAIIVNREARRFASESESYKTLGDLLLRQPDGLGFQIFDQKIMAQSVEMPITHNYMAAYERGLIKSASSPKELAERIGLNPATLEQTMERYNSDVRRGADTQFGRATLGRNYGDLVTIDTAPFYIYPCTSALFSTYGGVRVDSRLQVIRADGTSIDGLYAVGEIMGGLHGKAYMSGSSLSKSAIFGRLAGRHAAQVAAAAR